MSDTPTTGTPAGDTDGNATGDQGDPRDVVETELAVLREENRRLREEHRRLLRTTYRRSALGFGALAALAVGAAVLFGAVRELLLVIAAIAAFAGLLTYYLTPERFVAATVGESVYTAVARTGRDLIDDLGLHDTQLYLPVDGAVRVFVPQHREYEIPTLDGHDGVFVVPGTDQARGILLWPTGHALYDAFETTTGKRNERHVPDQLAEALVEQFELVDQATVDSRDAGRVTVAVAGSAYGDIDRFDHPVGSLLATGLAATRDTPVELDTTPAEDSRWDALITCRWSPDTTDTADTDPGWRQG